MHSTTYVAKQLGFKRQTISNWAKEFTGYLSPTANPSSSGSHRRFSDDDLKVFSLIASMSRDGLTFADMHASLASGTRGELPEPNLDALAVADVGQVALLQETIIRMQSKIGDLEQRLHVTTTAKDRAEGAVDEVRRERDALREQVIKLRIQIAKHDNE